MPHTPSDQARRIFTRRALVNAIHAHAHDRDPNPLGARARSRFPMTLIVGLMTIGVILLISLLQLLAGLIG
jgi:hypothetical protein